MNSKLSHETATAPGNAGSARAFPYMGRTLKNVIRNCMAAVVVAKWERA